MKSRRGRPDVKRVIALCVGVFFVVSFDAAFATFKQNIDTWTIQAQNTIGTYAASQPFPNDGQSAQTVYDPVNEVMHMLYWEANNYTLAHRSYDFNTQTFTAASLATPPPVGFIARGIAAAFDPGTGNIGVAVALHQDWTVGSPPPTIFFSQLRIDYYAFVGGVWQTPITIPISGISGITTPFSDKCVWEVPHQYANLSLDFTSAGKPALVMGIGEDRGCMSGSSCENTDIPCGSPTTPASANVYYIPDLLAPTPSVASVDSWTAGPPFNNSGSWTDTALTGGVALKLDAGDTARIAYSKLARAQTGDLRYVEVSSSLVVGAITVLDNDIETGFTISPGDAAKKMILVLDPGSTPPEEPRIAYEAHDATGNTYDIRYADRDLGVWRTLINPITLLPQTWQVAMRVPDGGFLSRVGDIVIDPLQTPIPGRGNEDRTIQIAAYSPNPLGIGSHTTFMLSRDTDTNPIDTPWPGEFGLNNTRKGQGLKAAVDPVTGRPQIMTLGNWAWSDDSFFASEGNNVYLRIVGWLNGGCGCPPPQGTITAQVTGPLGFSSSDFRGVGLPSLHNQYVLHDVLVPDATPATAPFDYNLIVTESTGNYTMTQISSFDPRVPATPTVLNSPGPNFPVPVLYAVPLGLDVTMTFTGTCPKCDCGAAPLFVGGVVLDSFGNAALPLVPALLALGVWGVARRRKSRREGEVS